MLKFAPEELELILEIFKGAGLVFLVRGDPANRYQLVHDYLVKPIRQIKAKREAKKGQEIREGARLTQEQLDRLIKRLLIVAVSMIVGIVIAKELGLFKEDCDSLDKQSTLQISSLSHC